MKKIISLILVVVLFGCEQEYERPLLKFSGVVEDGATRFPVANVWVRINLYGSAMNLLKSDSVLTNASGYYSFEFKDNGANQYVVMLEDDYRSPCYGVYQPVLLGMNKNVTRGEEHIDNLESCMTGIVKLNLNKLTPSKKDTLVVFVMVGMVQTHVIKASESKSMSFPFYSDRLNSVRFEFAVIRENGEFPTWTQTEAVVPQATREVSVDF